MALETANRISTNATMPSPFASADGQALRSVSPEAICKIVIKSVIVTSPGLVQAPTQTGKGVRVGVRGGVAMMGVFVRVGIRDAVRVGVMAGVRLAAGMGVLATRKLHITRAFGTPVALARSVSTSVPVGGPIRATNWYPRLVARLPNERMI